MTVGGAFLVLATLAWWRGRLLALALLATAGTLLLVAGLTVPGRLGPVYRAWMAMAHGLSRITTPIFLGVIYFFVLTPVGWLRRLFGRPTLRRPAAATSFWVSRPADARQRADMEHQF
jgi:HAMP domain-containing protein